jgi:small-conductance mechanosensitive channel
MRGAAVSGLLLAGLFFAPPALAQGTTPGAAPASSQNSSQAVPALSEADLRALVEAAKATAAAARESVDYARVTPDILTQILAKLDKLENKLDKIENAIKAGGGAPRRQGR